jgi:pimeloyl-ACP methyl ester carboxylesterase
VGLAYERVGAGPPLVLLHGIGHRRQAWYAVLGLLAPHRDLVLVDLPGHGESPPLDTAGRSVARALMDEILGLFAELDLDRPHLAGNSLGGRIALEAAAAGRAASVTAISPAGFWRSSGELAYARAVDRAMEAGARIFRRLGPLLARSTFGRALIYADIVSRPSRVSPDQARGDFAAFLAARSAINKILAAATPFTGIIPAEVPVTIAWGTSDHLLPRGQAMVAQERLPSAHLVALPGCGHVPMTDDPRLVADVLLRGSGTAAGVVAQRGDVGYVGLGLHSVGTCARMPSPDVLDPPRGERQYEYWAFVGVRHVMCR